MQLPHQQGSDADVVLPSLRAAVFVVDDSQPAGGWGQLHYVLRVPPTGRLMVLICRLCVTQRVLVAPAPLWHMSPSAKRCPRVFVALNFLLSQGCATR